MPLVVLDRGAAGVSAARAADRVAAAPLVVECVGLPGAGKSTVTSALLARLTSGGLRAVDIELPRRRGVARLRYHVAFGRFLLRRWRLALDVARYGVSVRPLSRERLRFAWSVLIHRFQLDEHRARPADVVVLHQAGLQAAWSVAVAGSPPPPDRVRRLLAELLRDTDGWYALVHFDVGPVAALERIARRPTRASRFDRMPPAEAMRCLPDLQEHLGALVDAARAAGVSVLRLDAHRPVETARDTIAEFVHERVTTRSAPWNQPMPRGETEAAARG